MLADQIQWICSQLDMPLVPHDKREGLMVELRGLLAKRELMLKTLSSPNDFRGTVDSTDPE